MKKIKKSKSSRVYVFFVISCLLITINSNIYASNTFQYQQSDLDIMFVVDYSNSMNSNDKQKIALQMIEAFIDSTFSEKMRVGFTAYNHTILTSSKPIELTKKHNRDQLKAKINSISRSGSTDIGLALKHAEKLLDKDNKRQSVIILLSDGEPDLTYVKNGRTTSDSYKDMDAIGESCKENNIPIYSIAFGEQFDGETSTLNKISTMTEGTFYSTKQPGDLVEIFNAIIKKYTMSSVVPVVSSLASGDLQTIEIPFESHYTKEANVLLISSSPIEEANVFYVGNDIDVNQSKYYFTCKINNPEKNNLKLQYRTQKGEAVKVYLLLYQDVDFIVDMKIAMSRNIPSEVNAYFVEKDTNEKIVDKAFYDNFKPEVKTIDQNGNKQNIPIIYNEGKLTGTVTLGQLGKYKMSYRLQGISHALELDEINLEVINEAPIGELVVNEEYSPIQETKYFQVDEVITDPNGDSLKYSISNLIGDAAFIQIVDNQLMIKPNKIGKVSFYIVATDSEGSESISPISQISVIPVWKYYIGVTLIVFGIIGISIMIVIRRYIKKKANEPKPVYSGKVNVYFTKMPEDMETPLLTFSFFQMSPKRISLQLLLEGAGYTINNLELDKVYFEPGLERQITVYHETKNTVMLGSSIACRKLKYSIAYGTKIYITSPDETYDIELHFVSPRN